MMRRQLAAFAAAAGLAAAGLAVAGGDAAAETRWVVSPAHSCALTCGGVGGAVASGFFQGASSEIFYVCSANAGSEGYRAGYNLDRPGFANRCVVGFGGAEQFLEDYRCLCEVPPARAPGRG